MVEWKARFNVKTSKVLCGYPRCDGHLGYVTIDEHGSATGLQLPAGFDGLTRPGRWRLSNHARGRRPDLEQRVRLRSVVPNDVTDVGGDHQPVVSFPVHVTCPKCGRRNVAEKDALQPPVDGVLN